MSNDTDPSGKREAVEQLCQAIEREGWTIEDVDAAVDPRSPLTEATIRVRK